MQRGKILKTQIEAAARTRAVQPSDGATTGSMERRFADRPGGRERTIRRLRDVGRDPPRLVFTG